MSSLQATFDQLTEEVSHILDELGYYSPSLVLKIRLLPFEGWEFECLVSPSKGMVRKTVAKATSADELLRVLRERITYQLQLT